MKRSLVLFIAILFLIKPLFAGKEVTFCRSEASDQCEKDKKEPCDAGSILNGIFGEISGLADNITDSEEEYLSKNCANGSSQIDDFLKDHLVFYSQGKGKREYDPNDEKMKSAFLKFKGGLCETFLSIDDLDKINHIFVIEDAEIQYSEVYKLHYNVSDLAKIPQDIYNKEPFQDIGYVVHDENNTNLFISSSWFDAKIKHRFRSYGYFNQMLDHELAHVLHFTSSEFKKKIGEFVSIRYTRGVGFNYNQTGQRLSSLYLEKVEEINLKNNLTDKEKEKELNKLGKEYTKHFQEFFKDSKLPMRWGYYTERELRGPELKGIDLNFDGRAFDNSIEYFAVAVELFRHDKKLAQKYYSEEELKWLEENIK